MPSLHRAPTPNQVLNGQESACGPVSRWGCDALRLLQSVCKHRFVAHSAGRTGGSPGHGILAAAGAERCDAYEEHDDHEHHDEVLDYRCSLPPHALAVVVTTCHLRSPPRLAFRRRRRLKAAFQVELARRGLALLAAPLKASPREAFDDQGKRDPDHHKQIVDLDEPEDGAGGVEHAGPYAGKRFVMVTTWEGCSTPDRVHCVPMLLETSRLLLRPMHAADVDALVAMDSDPEVMRYIASGAATDLPAQRAKVEAFVASPPYRAPLGFWAITRRGDDRFRGWACLKPLEQGPDIEVGYRLPRAEWGQGFATEAAARLLRHGFESVELEEIVAVTHPENAASQRVLEKVGLGRRPDREAYGIRTRAFAITRRAYLERS